MQLFIAALSVRGRAEALCRAESSRELIKLVYEYFRKARENGYHVDVEYWRVDNLRPDDKTEA